MTRLESRFDECSGEVIVINYLRNRPARGENQPSQAQECYSRGPTSKALGYGSANSRFKSCQDHLFQFVQFSMERWPGGLYTKSVTSKCTCCFKRHACVVYSVCLLQFYLIFKLYKVNLGCVRTSLVEVRQSNSVWQFCPFFRHEGKGREDLVWLYLVPLSMHCQPEALANKTFWLIQLLIGFSLKITKLLPSPILYKLESVEIYETF